MNDNQPSSSQPSTTSSFTTKVQKYVWVLIVIHLLLILFSAYLFADVEVSGDWGGGLFAGAISFLFAVPLSMLSLYLAYYSFKTKHFVATILLVVMSVINGTGLSAIIANNLSDTLVPVARYASQKQERDYEKIVRKYYEDLSKQFQNPQKIVTVKNDRLWMEDGKELKLYTNRHAPELYKFEQYAIANLVGRNVELQLPSFEEFLQEYPVMDGQLVEIPVLILVNNRIINTDFY